MRARVVFAGVGLLCLLLIPRARADLYNDAGVHDIVSGSYDTIDVDRPPPPTGFTTVNFGGTATTNWLDAFNNSQVAMNGGEVGRTLSTHDNSQATVNGVLIWDGIRAYDNSQVTVGGPRREIHGGVYAYDSSRVTLDEGRIYGGALIAYDSSRVTMNGGRSDGFLAYGESRTILNEGSNMVAYVYDNSRVTMNGGRITQGGLYAHGDSRVTINAGSISESLIAYDNSRVTLNGGWVGGELYALNNGRLTVNGGSFGQVWVSDQATVTIFGSDFAVYKETLVGDLDLVFSGYGDLTSLFDNCYLSGTLANGDLLAGARLHISGDSEISLVPLPGAALLGVIGLGYAGMRLRRSAC